mgnify:CR=1 FL=1
MGLVHEVSWLMHLIVVSSYKAAFERWRPRLVSLNACRRSGVLPDGEKVRFVGVAHVGLLGTARVDSYELDEGVVSAAVVEIMEGRGVPAICKGE